MGEEDKEVVENSEIKTKEGSSKKEESVDKDSGEDSGCCGSCS